MSERNINKWYHTWKLISDFQILKSMSETNATIQVNGDIIIITFINKQNWQNEIEKLKWVFGKLIFQEYEKKLGIYDENNPNHLERMEYQCQVSFAWVDKIYVLTDNEKLVGFIATEQFEIKGCSVLRDVILDPNMRDQKLGKKLYSLVFDDIELETLIGYSKTPQAIKSRTFAGNQFNFKTFYGSEIPSGSKGSELAVLLLKYLEANDLLSWNTQQLPLGYAQLKSEYNILPNQLLDENLIKDQNNNILPSFKILNDLQQTELDKNTETDEADTIVWLLISIRNLNQSNQLQFLSKIWTSNWLIENLENQL